MKKMGASLLTRFALSVCMRKNAFVLLHFVSINKDGELSDNMFFIKRCEYSLVLHVRTLHI